MSSVRLSRLLAGALVLGALAGCATVPMSEGGAPVVDATVGGGQGASMAAVARSAPLAAEAVAATPAPSLPPGNLLDRIQAGFQLPELPERVLRAHIRRITSNPEYLERVFDRGGR